MKKNLGTSRDPRQESPDRGKWSKVRHLGFVVDFGLPPTDALTHALINLAEAPNRWYVVGLSADNYPPETKAVVPRFFETVFVAAVNALLTYERHGELRLDEVIMERTVPQYALLAFKLRQWARSDTSDSASPDFPVLRLSIYHSLFGARGTKRDLDVVWKGESGPDAIFLWTPQKLKSSPFMNLGDGPFQTIELAGFAPETELAVESVTGLTKALTAQLSAVWPPGIKTTAPIANYQTYVRRQWEMDWQPAKISVGGDGHPPFIGDQGIRVLRLSKPGYTPRHFLRVEYLRRLRAETYRRHMSRQILPSKYGLQRYRNNAERLLSEAGSDPSGIPREAWRPITRQELCARLGDITSKHSLRRSVVVTEAGVGKTTNMRWLHCALNSSHSTGLAILVDAADLPENAETLIPETLALHLRQAAWNAADVVPQARLEKLLYTLRKEGQLSLLIDGLDQIQTTETTCLQTLKHVLRDENWADCTIVLGTRPYAMERYWGFLFGDERATGWNFLLVEEFNDDQQRYYLGSPRYDAIPPDARAILSVPRVLYYLRRIPLEDYRNVRTTSDVYWLCTSRMLEEGLRAHHTRGLDPNEARFLLSAIAFEMAAGCQNFDGVRQNQMDRFLSALSVRCRSYDSNYELGWCRKKLREVAAMNEFLSYGLLEAGCPQEIYWRNRSLQEFFAGMWLTKFSGGREAEEMSKFIHLPTDPETGAFYWIWRFAAEMPEAGRDPEAWVRAMSPMYSANYTPGRTVKRSNEMLYRSWVTMHSYAQTTNAADVQESPGYKLAREAIESFQSEFSQSILQGRRGKKKKRIAEQLLTDFRPIPKDYGNRHVKGTHVGAEFGPT